MISRIVWGSALASALVAGAIFAAGTPFGGDDSGTIPSDAPKGPVTKCEGKVAKSVGKLVASIIKCHSSRVSGKLADDAGEDACETAAKAKFVGKTKTTGCTACIDLTFIGDAVEGLLDGNNNKVYCAPGTPWGGDDTGNIPADAPKGPVSKCSGKVAKSVGKLVASIIKCHIGRASGKFADNTAEEACEVTALGKFGSTKTDGCDACISLGPLGLFVEGVVDGANDLTYCAASPSGAFLDQLQ